MGYIITNYVLLCVAAVLGVTLFRGLKTHKRTNIYLLLIIGFTLLISVLDYVRVFAQTDLKNADATIALSAILYVLRPVCILFFIFLCGQKFKGISFYILLVPLLFDIFVNILVIFGETRQMVFYYSIGESGTLDFHDGNVLIFRYAPHIVSAIYLIYLIYKSIALLQRKHIADAFGIMICSAVVATATIIETFFNEDGTVYLLPSSIAISTIFYYLFLYERNNKIDVLTGLFNRASYYDDLAKYSKEITGVIQFDMNGLKFLNDNMGHLEGDKALARIGEAITNSVSRKMYAYRLGGDEFIVLAMNESEENILETISKFKKEIEVTSYHCSIGYAFKDKKTNSLDAMYKQSEKRMYQDKADFYKTSKIERRKSN